ncbi:hypothetical protein RZS08_47270, partial [Arthrospira platensis SPKY1]|nr:hypothetical protein [Arthrospira platensis SPKY1]
SPRWKSASRTDRASLRSDEARPSAATAVARLQLRVQLEVGAAAAARAAPLDHCRLVQRPGQPAIRIAPDLMTAVVMVLVSTGAVPRTAAWQGQRGRLDRQEAQP